MAKDETRRWRGWRTAGEPAPIKGSRPTKKPGTRRKGGKPKPWYWVRSRGTKACERCEATPPEGEVIAWSRPSRVRCSSCVAATGLNVKVGRQLAEEGWTP